MIRVREIAPGLPGIRQTLEIIRQHILAPSRFAPQKVHEILAGLPQPPSRLAAAGAIFKWVQEHMVYTPDSPWAEEIRSPDWLLNYIEQRGAAPGDCDDYVTLEGKLLLTDGIRPTLVAVNTDPEWQREGHVYLRVQTEAGPVTLDAIHGQPMGWELPDAGAMAQIEVPV